MLLTEILDQKVQCKVTANNPVVFRTSAVIGDRVIEFECSKTYDRDYEDCWDAHFQEKAQGSSKQTFGVSGSGNELQVFSMVRDSFAQFMEVHKPQAVRFSAAKDAGQDGNSRGNLYARLLQRFAAASGYQFSREDSGGKDEFLLVRQEQPEQQLAAQ